METENLSTSKILRIHPADNVAVALADLPRGMSMKINGVKLSLTEHVSQKHKFALSDLKPGEKIYQYGVIVGEAVLPIFKGEPITVKNIRNAVDETIKKSEITEWNAPDVSPFSGKTFQGYHRSNGQAGTANYWVFVPLVFCENRNLLVIREALEKALGYRKPDKYLAYTWQMVEELHLQKMGTNQVSELQADRIFENIDGVRFLIHQGGCGGTRQDAETLIRLLAGYIHHPNVAGATVLSLGCQNAQLEMLQQAEKELYPDSKKPVLYFEQQQTASEEQLIQNAIRDTLEVMIEVNKTGRQPVGLEKLVLGVECGGSDGFSSDRPGV